MALRAGGGRNRQDVPDEFGDGEEPTRISRIDPTLSDGEDEEDDGLGSSTVVGVPTPPPRARTAGVGKLEFDDEAVDEVLSAIEEKAAIVPASTPAAPFAAVPQPPSPVTHGGRSSGLIPADPPPAHHHPSAPYPVAPMVHHPSTPYPPYPAIPYPTPQPYPPPQYPAAPPMGMHTPIPTGSVPAAAAKSRAPLYAVVGVAVLLVGGVAAYMVVGRTSKKTEADSGSGSGHVVATGSSDPSGLGGSAGSAGVPNGSGASAGSAGSAAAATGSAGSAGSAAPAEPVSVKGELVSVEHPVVEHLAAEVKGEIARVAVPTTRDVKEGDVLFTIKARSGANVGALQKRVSELQALAKDDPDSYAPFLRRARNELRQAQAPIITTVKASSDGAFQSKVKVGDHVDAGTVLGNFVDARTWIAVGSVTGTTPTATWTCTVADNTHTAACKIQATEVINEGAGTRMTVEISATGTSWLAGPSRPWLVVEPPSH